MENTLIDAVYDVDSHEMMPMALWADAFGPIGGALAAQLGAWISGRDRIRNLGREDLTGDTVKIDRKAIWSNKGCGMPGTIDMARRLDVLDAMGIERQFIFPTFGLFGNVLTTADAAALSRYFMIDLSESDRRAFGSVIMTAHNDWAISEITADPDRLRIVGVVPAHDLSELMKETERLIAAGIRAIWLPTVPPGGRSPAHPSLDEFWSLLEEADVSALLHAGEDFSFMRDLATWGDSPHLDILDLESVEFPAAPIHYLATNRFSYENYITTLVLGGVFDRHPRLRVGLMGATGQWVAPLMDGLDMWSNIFPKLSRTLQLRPSEYFARNIRVSPFGWEPIDTYIENDPRLADVLVYSSNYPCAEGGRNSKTRAEDVLSRLGDTVLEKFFRRNAEWLMPSVNTAHLMTTTR